MKYIWLFEHSLMKQVNHKMRIHEENASIYSLLVVDREICQSEVRINTTDFMPAFSQTLVGICEINLLQLTQSHRPFATVVGPPSAYRMMWSASPWSNGVGVLQS
jgi:hypothetical protein